VNGGGRLFKWILFGAGVLCLFAAFTLAAVFKGAFAPAPIVLTPAPAVPETEPRPETAPPDAKWAVYVSGEVLRPGVYEITPGLRVNDAIRLAGGFTPRAGRDAINLAEKLRDEAHIVVPAAAVFSPRAAASGDAAPANPGPPTQKAAVKYPGGAGSENSGKININTADASLFSTLPGIGPKLSAAIVAYREQNGPFPDIASLRSVQGLGAKRFAAIEALVAVSD
jgi:competence protein ComEA